MIRPRRGPAVACCVRYLNAATVRSHSAVCFYRDPKDIVESSGRTVAVGYHCKNGNCVCDLPHPVTSSTPLWMRLAQSVRRTILQVMLLSDLASKSAVTLAEVETATVYIYI